MVVISQKSSTHTTKTETAKVKHMHSNISQWHWLGPTGQSYLTFNLGKKYLMEI